MKKPDLAEILESYQMMWEVTNDQSSAEEARFLLSCLEKRRKGKSPQTQNSQ